MFQKFKDLFKKKQKTSSSDEYLDFSEYTDVDIGGVQPIASDHLKKKPIKQVGGIGEPDFLKKTDKKVESEEISNQIHDHTVIPNLRTEIIKSSLKKSPQVEKSGNISNDRVIKNNSEVDLTEVSMRDGKKKLSLITTLSEKLKNKLKNPEVSNEPMSEGEESQTVMGRFETVQFKIFNNNDRSKNIVRLILIVLIAVVIAIVLKDFVGEEEIIQPTVVKKKFEKTEKVKAEHKFEPRIEPKVATEKELMPPPATTIEEVEYKSSPVPVADPIPEQIFEPEPREESAPRPIITQEKDFPKSNPPNILDEEFPTESSPDFEKIETNKNVLTEDDLIEIENELSNEDDSDSITTLTDLSVNYLASGSGLVYNCVGKHWACVSKTNYIKCKKVSGFNPKRCYPFSFFNTKRSCQVNQIKNINSNEKADFCY